MKFIASLLFLCLIVTSVSGLASTTEKARLVTPEQKIKNYVARDFENRGRIEVERLFIKDSIPEEAEVIAVEPRPALGLVNFEFAWPESGVTRHAYGTASVKLYKPVVVAKTVIRNNEPFTKENCSLTEREVSVFRVTGYYDDLVILNTMRARGYINPGMVISHNHTQAPFLVSSGESIQLIRETPNVKVTIRAKALEHGKQDQWIRVENLSNKKVIQAKVIQAGEVSLH